MVRSKGQYQTVSMPIELYAEIFAISKDRQQKNFIENGNFEKFPCWKVVKEAFDLWKTEQAKLKELP